MIESICSIWYHEDGKRSKREIIIIIIINKNEMNGNDRAKGEFEKKNA